MSQIQIMPSQLANQIAAGEVIERPASVVKELIENAIDAGADKIDVAIEESGLKLIRVTDNGKGIAYDEVTKAFERHATSKLLNQESLFRIKTLGFRGEALPSIASVSDLLIETAQPGQKGKSVQLSGGKLISEHSSAARAGTMIQVTDLFFNTPARLKHIKSMKTELTHITSTLNRFALTHPGVSFKLINEGMTLMNTSGSGQLHQAIAGVYGVKMAKKMKAVSGENFDFQVQGYVSLPDVSRSNRSYMTIIINDRYIKNYALANAIVKGYGSKLMIGRYPVAVIKITTDSQLLDVNVHPTKDQVRISNEDSLAKLIEEAVKSMLDNTVRIPAGLENINQNTGRKDQEISYRQERLNFNDQDNQNEKDHFQRPFESSGQPSASRVSDAFETYPSDRPQDEAGWGDEPDSSKALMSSDQLSPTDHQKDNFVDQAKRSLQADQADQASPAFPELDYIGQMHGTYLFAQNEDGLYIIDQHAAQERIKYEYYREVIGDTNGAQQTLLEPIILEYPTDDYLRITDYMEELSEAGIELESFGGNTFIVKSHPTWFIRGQEEGTIKEMIDFLLTHKSISVKTFREATAIMMSCKRSIKANHYLSDMEARALIEDLKKCQNPYNCPHGRPVLVSLSNRDMEKMFKRIQDR